MIADVVPGRDETGDLLERESQLELFRWRRAASRARVDSEFERARRGARGRRVRGVRARAPEPGRSTAARGYLQEHGRLTGPRCKAVTREVNRLCDEVRGDGGALVDAFGIPDPVLRAPIGLRDPASS